MDSLEFIVDSLIHDVMTKAGRHTISGFADLLFCMQMDNQFARSFRRYLTVDELLLLSKVIPSYKERK